MEGTKTYIYYFFLFCLDFVAQGGDPTGTGTGKSFLILPVEIKDLKLFLQIEKLKYYFDN